MEDDWSDDDLANYRGTEYIGKLGVEQSYEKRAARHDRLRAGRDLRAGGRAVRRLASKPATPGNTLRAVDRHPAAGDGRGAVRRPARRAGRHRPAQRRDPGLRQQADLRSQPVRRRHRRRELEGAERVARQAAAQPRAARHLPARLDLQALHGAGGAARSASARRSGRSSTRATSTSATTASATTSRRRPRHRRHVQVDRRSRATPTTTCSPTTWASTRSTTSWRRSASASSPASTCRASCAACCRRPSGSATPTRGRSSRSGTPARRSRSASARATTPSRCCSWRRPRRRWPTAA